MDETQEIDELLSSNEIEIIKQDDKRFPESLKNLPKGRSPEKLYVQGKDFSFNKCIAIIGTRKPSQEGLELSFEIANTLVQHGFTIVSGLARGIDAAAHKGALDNDGPTIAVLEGLPDVYPPEHKELADAITKSRCVITENFPNEKNIKFALVKRNEIIAALSDAIIVIESSESGGAHYAIDYGQKLEKLIIAMEPRAKNNEIANGFTKFLSDGASPAKTVEDVIQILDSYEKPKKTNLDDFIT